MYRSKRLLIYQNETSGHYVHYYLHCRQAFHPASHWYLETLNQFEADQNRQLGRFLLARI